MKDAFTPQEADLICIVFDISRSDLRECWKAAEDKAGFVAYWLERYEQSVDAFIKNSLKEAA